MKLVTYRRGSGEACTGAVLDPSDPGSPVLDLSDWVAALPVSDEAERRNQKTGIPAPAGGMLRLLQAGPEALDSLVRHVDAHGGTAGDRLDRVMLLAPVPRPGKIIGVGRNYADHAKETGVGRFEKPRIIFKVPSSVTAPNAAVPRCPGVAKMDYEAELAVVIGGYGKNVAEADALRLVAGYTILNDLSAREFQFDIAPPQTTFAKSPDGFAPMGPWLVTRDEIDDPQALEVRCWLNGEMVQQGRTADMLFPVATLVAYLSGYMTLEPGDVITTGTPAGVGAFRQPPVYLRAGDRLQLEVTGVGTMENRIV